MIKYTKFALVLGLVVTERLSFLHLVFTFLHLHWAWFQNGFKLFDIPIAMEGTIVNVFESKAHRWFKRCQNSKIFERNYQIVFFCNLSLMILRSKVQTCLMGALLAHVFLAASFLSFCIERFPHLLLALQQQWLQRHHTLFPNSITTGKNLEECNTGMF